MNIYMINVEIVFGNNVVFILVNSPRVDDVEDASLGLFYEAKKQFNNSYNNT